MLKVAIIEDEDYAYNAIVKKLKSYSDLVHESTVNQIDDSTSITIFVESLKKNPADIYFVDWELKFINGTKNIRDVFKLLSKYKFSFLDKFWVFISNKPGNEIPELLGEYFPLNFNYVTPGKANIIGDIPKSGRNHFDECINMATSFINKQTKPDWVSGEIDFKTMVTFENFNGHYYDLSYIINKENESHVLTIAAEGAICFVSFDPYGLLLFIDHIKGLRACLFKLNDDATVVKNQLYLEGKRIFFFNGYYIENGHLKEEFREYITSKIKFIKGVNPPDLDPKIIQCFFKIKRELEKRKILI